MSQHSLAEAQTNLPDLVARAARGEEVVLTCDGKPVAKLSALPQERPVLDKAARDAELDWLAERRKGRGRIRLNAGEAVSRMRDEDWR